MFEMANGEGWFRRICLGYPEFVRCFAWEAKPFPGDVCCFSGLGLSFLAIVNYIVLFGGSSSVYSGENVNLGYCLFAVPNFCCDSLG